MPNEILSEVAVELNAALDKLPCIHGFRASAEIVEAQDGNAQAKIQFGCYECRQTWSYPSGMDTLVESILDDNASHLADLGITVIRPHSKEYRTRLTSQSPQSTSSN